ncbi:type II secretion system F family protein [Galenea microaerophila]
MLSLSLLSLLILSGALVFLSILLIGKVIERKEEDLLAVERLKARVGMQNHYQREVVEKKVCDWCALGRVLGPKDKKEIEKIENQLIRAGYRTEDSVGAYFFIKTFIILFGVFIALVAWAWFNLSLPLAIFIPIVFMLTPEHVLNYLGNRRLERVNTALPDFLDMTNICMNAGLSYLVALKRVTSELKEVYPEVCFEFEYMLDQIQLGVPRIQALKQFAERNPTEDIQQLVLVLIQNEKLGTPIAKAISDFTRRMYQEREQRLEEKAAKTSAKMAIVIFPFLMLPYFILLLGEKMVMLGRNW